LCNFLAVCSLAEQVIEAPLAVRTNIDARLVSGPTADRSGDVVKIAFEVSAETDVEVAVLDAQRKTVRHLAAGLLGKNAPEPFREDSLSQEIEWDMLNDGKLYVTDSVNRRIVVVRFEYAAEGTSSLP